MFKFSRKSLENLRSVDERLVVLAEEVLKATPYDFGITCGFRTVEEQQKMYERGVSKCDGIIKKSKHQCLSKDMEILTNNGWKNINTILYTDKCYSFNIEKKKIEIVNIDNIIKEKRNECLISIKNKHIDLMITKDHNMLIKTFNNQYKTKNIKNYSNSAYHNNLKLDFKLKQAQEIYNKRIKIPVCGEQENIKSRYNINYLKLLIAIICDGCVSKNKKYNSFDISFTLKKERKINFLEKLLKKLDIKYSKNYCKCREKQGQFGVYKINILGGKKTKQPIIDLIGENKNIPNFFLELSMEEKIELLETYIFFDGHKDSRYNNDSTIKSINEHNIDILQIMAITSNYRCIKKVIKKEKLKSSFKHNKDIFLLCLTKNRIYEKINENTSYSLQEYNDYVWCISNINHTIIVRRNGKIAIIGNCGKAIDIIVYDEEGKGTWKEKYYIEVANIFKEKAKELNIKIIWGGDFKSIVDMPHFELC